MQPFGDGAEAPPENLLRAEVAQFIADYLRRFGPIRGAFEIERGADNSSIPAPSMPGYIHMALSAIASNPATPYSGNVVALVRDLVYLGLGAYGHVLLNYIPENPGVQFTQHIISREEVLRREAFKQSMSWQFAFDIMLIAEQAKISLALGDRDAIFQQMQLLFRHIEGCDQLWRRILVRIAGGIPEIRAALSQLRQSVTYANDPDVVGWIQWISEVQYEREEST